MANIQINGSNIALVITILVMFAGSVTAFVNVQKDLSNKAEKSELTILQNNHIKLEERVSKTEELKEQIVEIKIMLQVLITKFDMKQSNGNGMKAR
jgi:Tfp pilus assembly protein PilO